MNDSSYYLIAFICKFVGGKGLNFTLNLSASQGYNIALQNKCLENMVAVKKLNANYVVEYNLVSGNNGY